MHYLSVSALQGIDGFLDNVVPMLQQEVRQSAQLQQASQAMAAAHHVKLAQMAESLLTALSKPGACKISLAGAFRLGHEP